MAAWSAAPPRVPDKPFALAAQADQPPRADRQPVEQPHRLRRRHHQRRRRTQPRAHRDVPADHHVQPPQLPVTKQLLQAENRSLDVVGPIAAGRLQQPLQARAVNHPLPIIPVQAGHQVGDAEGLLRKLRPFRVGQRDHVVRPRRGHHDDLAVDRHHVDRAALVINVPPHEVDPPRRAHDRHLPIRAIAVDKRTQRLADLLPGNLLPIPLPELPARRRRRVLQQAVPLAGRRQRLPANRRRFHHRRPLPLPIDFLDGQQLLRVVERHQITHILHFAADDPRRLWALGQDLEHVRQIFLLAGPRRL